MAVTIKDVAKKAGVSISTVSRVINKSKPVSPEIRKKVLEVIDELGYRPNEIARTLVTKKSYLIGLIVTDISNPYIAEMVRGVEEIGKMYNYDVLLCSTYGDKAAEMKYMQLLNRKQVEGIILISDELRGEIKEKVKEIKIPFVYLSRYTYEKDYPTVTINYLDAAYEMTNYLISLGHKNIAYLGNKGEENSLSELMLKGYKKAIKENDKRSEIIYLAKGKKIEHGYNVAKEILDKNSDVTAIFCSNDELAIGVINYFHDNNIKVPEDISVTGCGDIKIASILRPKLTTIREPFYDIGAVAIRRIIKELKGEKVEEKDIILPFKIEKRDSTKKLK
ncbi:LacI family DNA-binding transcriptional regulator [Thermohalobacter berrensis]|uniref:LacI family transcriptional regulator n=1 Tax=Thermohalobacter berrensis TaxID=99594 RepID=A0A419T1Z4_9FIRM|nr:LacI family DNA-binding transcriptional regulator [Thermohalobacter berrensis]RKD31449.1 LacI family transcriptional regulator [Thermohalobacter berrensis]